MAHETNPPEAIEGEDAPPWVRLTGLVTGPVLGAAALVWAHPQLGAATSLSAAGAWTLAILLWMAVWWMTTAVDLAVTALLPVLLFPVLGVGTIKENAAPYADEIILLFAGGAVIGRALESTGVSVHFAGALLRMAGTSPRAIVIALFTATAFVSAWVSNTATAAMMLPVAMAAVKWARDNAGPAPERERALRNFGVAALLSVAYGASVGGLLTIIGSPPNAIAAEWLNKNAAPMDFVRWMKFSGPVVLVFGPLAVGILLMMNPMRGLDLKPQSAAPVVRAARAPLDRAGWIAVSVFGLAAVSWVTYPFIPGLPKDAVTDAAIAVGAAMLLFLLPRRVRPWTPVLPASTLHELPWSVLILFGGGLSLSGAMQRSGLSATIGQSFSGLSELPAPLIVGSVVAALVFASEIASNTALAATAVPILGAMAPALGLPPEKLVIPAAYGASYAFMLPVGTPPNALVYATGLVPLPRMLRTGVLLNVTAAFVITVMTFLLL